MPENRENKTGGIVEGIYNWIDNRLKINALVEYMGDKVVFQDGESSEVDEDGNIRVYRVQWKSLRKLGKLEYLDDNGDKILKTEDCNRSWHREYRLPECRRPCRWPPRPAGAPRLHASSRRASQG